MVGRRRDVHGHGQVLQHGGLPASKMRHLVAHLGVGVRRVSVERWKTSCSGGERRKRCQSSDSERQEAVALGSFGGRSRGRGEVERSVGS